MKIRHVLAASAVLAACAGDTSPNETETPSPRTLTLDLEPGHQVDYALGPDGSLTVGELGSLSDHQPVYRQIDLAKPGDVFKKYHPGEPVPASVQAFERALAVWVRSIPSADEISPADEQPGLPEDRMDDVFDMQSDKHATSDANHFTDSHFGCFFGSDNVATFCLLNRTNGGVRSASSRWAIYKIASYVGQVTQRVRINGSIVADDTILEGQFSYRWARGGLTGGSAAQYPVVADHQVEVLNATGDWYHRSARFHNYKMASSACAEVMSSAPVYDPTGAFWCTDHYGNSGAGS